MKRSEKQSENPFEAGIRKVIPAVLVYLRHKNAILMIHRNSIQEGRIDYHQGKWNGLGGKCELDESPLQAVQREVWEESGLVIGLAQFRPLGTVQFPHFKAHKNEDWMVFVFVAELNEQQFQSKLVKSGEGDLHWVPIYDFKKLNLWPGDQYFLPYVIDNKPFMGTIWYEGPQVTRHWIQGL
jgi:8-oxo-dGTP diphosphatase